MVELLQHWCYNYNSQIYNSAVTVYPKKYAHGFCFAVLCCGYTLTDFPISIRLTSLTLWQSNDCPSASKATLMNMDKYFMWIHYERLHNHNKAKHNKTVCIFLGIYCIHIFMSYMVFNFSESMLQHVIAVVLWQFHTNLIWMTDYRIYISNVYVPLPQVKCRYWDSCYP